MGVDIMRKKIVAFAKDRLCKCAYLQKKCNGLTLIVSWAI